MEAVGLFDYISLGVQAVFLGPAAFEVFGLPVSLADLGLGQVGLHELRQACRFACRPDSDLHHLPFTVSPGALLEALVGAAEPSLLSS